MSQASFDAYNNFLLEGHPDRFTKILARYELYKTIIALPGDIVECGVFKGQGLLFWAKLIQIFNPLSPRKVIGFDTFSGVPDTVTSKSDRDSSVSFRDYTGVPAQVMETARAQGLDHRIQIVAGDASLTIPKFATENRGLRVALLNLDFDVYEPTKAALNALYDKIVPDGVICFDEYAIHNWGESDAADEVLAGKGLRLNAFPWALSPTAYCRKPV
jgi:hypothetical protein